MRDIPSYDIALSFAGEDRDYVNKVADLLLQEGVRVFFDSFEQVSLWGKDLYRHLIVIYQHSALYSVIFISSHYRDKLWTKLEFKAAAARAFTESREYLLPARFDDTDLDGIPLTTGHVDLRRHDPAEFAKIILQKLRLDPRFVARMPGGNTVEQASVLSRPPSLGAALTDLQICELYAGYLHCKTDDLRLVRSVIGQSHLGDVLDLCGGYGRASFELQAPKKRWVIIDRSLGMLEISQKLFRGYDTQPEYICADLEDPNFRYHSHFDSVLCLYNSINEIENLNKFAALASGCLQEGGILFIKCIIHDDRYDRATINHYPSEICFNLFAQHIVYDVMTEMEDSLSKEQIITLVFRSEQNQTLASLRWRRWIHETSEIDAACSEFGLKRTRTFQGGEYRLYTKSVG